MDGISEGLPINQPESDKPIGSEMDNFHIRKKRLIKVNGQPRTYEYIHQQRSGDCVLANFLNTWSFVHDGVLPMSVNEARYGAMNLRKDEGIDASSIQTIDSGLSQEDTVLLFSQLSDETVNWEEDVLSIEGQLDARQRQLKAIDILEYLATYNSGVCVTGLREHSRTIVKLRGDAYALLNPTNSEGLLLYDTERLTGLLTDLIANQPPESNFFYFVRGDIKASSTPNAQVTIE
jgi:hypothetical protein